MPYNVHRHAKYTTKAVAIFNPWVTLVNITLLHILYTNMHTLKIKMPENTLDYGIIKPKQSLFNNSNNNKIYQLHLINTCNSDDRNLQARD